MNHIAAFMVSMVFGATILLVNTGDVQVYIEMVTPIEEIEYGNEIELKCVVEGIDGDYIINWQYTDDELEWHDLECYEDTYKFILDETNVDYYYRVIILC